MRYGKVALTHEQQAKLLIAKGMAADENQLLERLRSANYYRLSGYWYPYLHGEKFIEGTDFTDVWRHYTFDRRFRLQVLDAIERVEVYVRSALAYELAHLQGPFGYEDGKNLPGLGDGEYADFMNRMDVCCARSSEMFIRHHASTYADDHAMPPYWVLVEVFDFGMTAKLYKGAPKQVQKSVAARLGVQVPVLKSWLHTLNTVRNSCAHHARLWNKTLGFKPKVPLKDGRWDYVRAHNDKLFAVLTILHHPLGRIAPQSQWDERLLGLIDEYPVVDLSLMGFPGGWRDADLWKDARKSD